MLLTSSVTASINSVTIKQIFAIHHQLAYIRLPIDQSKTNQKRYDDDDITKVINMVKKYAPKTMFTDNNEDFMKVYIAKVQSTATKLFKRLSIRVKEANDSQMSHGEKKTVGELQLE